ncbi:Histidine protein kinase DivJ [Clostridium sp. N3C]|uniref:sensor histidine kinase n=1 Tax=Clostridium sp. N3C TaxID=1776758 RepID=UPI00092E1ADC|nr:HAMP domain-containing sensor histidine kinase [Clostridium sp. N3C]SCN25407.1 Histidine protein kinase DivJ [Clostridium sp. N3C]
MRSVPKLIRRYISILLLSCVLLFILNFALLAIFMAKQTPNASPWKTAEEVAKALQLTSDEKYELPDSIVQELKDSNAWAIYIDNESKSVIWHTDNLPKTVPMSYTLSDIVSLTRGYIEGYPTFTGKGKNGLVVLGYPKDSFWKHMWPSWDYHTIANLPKTVLTVFIINAALIFLIYMVANSKLLKSIKPIVNGIQSLPTGEPVYVKEKGLLSELAMNINKTSEILQSQKNQLRRKETARANWIAGVSHDIRTPLSMVMGYASQLKEDTNLTDDERQKATVILKQSQRIKNLINDLNLASKLEYNMQPMNVKSENMIAIVRQVIVDFINMDIEDTHPIELEMDEDLSVCPVKVDKALIKRAVSNLIQNCINHNEKGCKIYVSVVAENNQCTVTVADDGIGVTDEQLKKLNNTPHYMICDENTTEQRHGLGLLIVKQIMAVHGGTTVIDHSSYGGFLVKLALPLES